MLKNTNITQSKPNQLESDRAVSSLHNLISFMPGNFYWKDTEGHYLNCNDSLLKMLGMSTINEMVGKTDYDLWPQYAEKIRENDREVMNSGQPVFFEEAVSLQEDQRMYFTVVKVPLFDSGNKIVGIIGNSLDITDRKKMEADLRAAKESEAEIRRAVMIFAGSMVHDLRNPLCVLNILEQVLNDQLPIMLNAYKQAKAANLLGIEKLDNSDCEYVAKIPEMLRNILEQMNKYIDDDLKTISHVVSGSKSQSDLVSCRMNHCIHEAINHYPFQGKEKELVSFKSNADFVFLGNPVLFYRIISNLLKNALYQIKKHGQGKILISTKKNGDMNILRFKDTAGGVTQGIVSRLFEDFNTTKQEGTGIGLAFCKFTMQSFGGDITAHCVNNDCIEFVLSFSETILCQK